MTKEASKKTLSLDPVDVLHSCVKDPDAYHIEFAKIQRRKQSALTGLSGMHYSAVVRQLIKLADEYNNPSDVAPLRSLLWRLDVSSLNTTRSDKGMDSVASYIRYVISNDVLPFRYHGTATDRSVGSAKPHPVTGMDFINEIIQYSDDYVSMLMQYLFWLLCERHLVLTKVTYEEYDTNAAEEAGEPQTDFEALGLDPEHVRVVLALDITRTFDVPATSIEAVPAKVTPSLSCATDVVVSLAHLRVDRDALPPDVAEHATPSACVVRRVVAGAGDVIEEIVRAVAEAVDDTATGAIEDCYNGFLSIDKDAKLKRMKSSEVRAYGKGPRIRKPKNSEDE